jgi:DNA-binding response OmpR family regulator
LAYIKLIDDDVEMAENLAILLQGEGHTVEMYHQTAGATDWLMAKRPDLLVLDVMFPDNPAGGFDLARDIRNHSELKGLPIILLTGVNQQYPMDFSEEDIDPAWMPVQQFVEKPVEIKALQAKIEHLLGGN